MLEQPKAPERWLWCHDLHYRETLTEEIAKRYTRVLAVSDWHASYLPQLYPFLSFLGEGVDVVPNGIELERFAGLRPEAKQHARFVYASSPDRGLATLLRQWPYIRRVEQTAELHIFYGWESFLKQAERGMHDLYRLHDQIQQLGQQPGVVWRGRVGQDELAREFMAADILAHPSSFLETGFIVGMEALAAGLMVVSTRAGNIPHVVGDAGICIAGNAGSIAYGRQFVGCVSLMMVDLETRWQYEGKGPVRAQSFSWAKAMERWESLLKPRPFKEGVVLPGGRMTA